MSPSGRATGSAGGTVAPHLNSTSDRPGAPPPAAAKGKQEKIPARAIGLVRQRTRTLGSQGGRREGFSFLTNGRDSSGRGTTGQEHLLAGDCPGRPKERPKFWVVRALQLSIENRGEMRPASGHFVPITAAGPQGEQPLVDRTMQMREVGKTDP